MTPEDIDRKMANIIDNGMCASTIADITELCRLARLALEARDVVRLADQYRQEHETPVPDLTLRVRLRTRLFDTAAAFLARLEGTD